MQFIKPNTNIDFIKKRTIASIVSATMIIVSIISIIIHNGLNYGIDFAGGTLIQVKFKTPITIDEVKTRLLSTKIKLPNVQTFGEEKNQEFLIKTKKMIIETRLSEIIKTALSSHDNRDVQIRRIEIVGPQIGKNIQEKALFAIFYALLIIAIYVSGRFELRWIPSTTIAFSLMSIVYLLSFLNISRFLLITSALFITLLLFWFMKLRYAMGAIIALIHDVIIIVGIFSILNKEFSLSIVAALLTTVGYSLNDTIIVFDRIRENLHKQRSNKFSTILNKSINETLGRTILTSLTTLIVIFSLLIFGGEIIHDFALAIAIGVIIGTYSSIYVASSILLIWEKWKKT